MRNREVHHIRREAVLPENLVLNSDGDPGVRLRISAPRQTFDGELIVARAQGRAVQRNAQVSVRILYQVVQYGHPTLINTVNGDAEGLVSRARLIDLEVDQLRGSSADRNSRSVGSSLVARNQSDHPRGGGWLERSLCCLFLEPGNLLLLDGDVAGRYGERDAEQHNRGNEAQNKLRPAPETRRLFLPGLGLAARFQQTQARVDPFRQTQLIEDLGVFLAEVLEIGGAFQG